MKAIVTIFTKNGLVFESKRLDARGKETFTSFVVDLMQQKTVLIQTSDDEFIGCSANDIDYFKIIFQE